MDENTTDVILDYLHSTMQMPRSDGGHAAVSNADEDSALADFPTMNGVDSLNGLIQGLRKFYEENGHKGNWNPVTIGSTAVFGNPLNSNPEIAIFKKTHKKILANCGRARVRASPMTEVLMIAMSLLYFLVVGASVAGIRMHAILTLGLYCALRADEIAKFDFSHVSIAGRMIEIDLSRGTKQCDRAKR